MIRLIPCILLGLFLANAAAVNKAQAESANGRCREGDDYFDVDFPLSSNKDSTVLRHYQGISIQKTALAMRYPPDYYAVYWDNVISISFKVLDDKSDEGVLSILFKEMMGQKQQKNLAQSINHAGMNCLNLSICMGSKSRLML